MALEFDSFAMQARALRGGSPRPNKTVDAEFDVQSVMADVGESVYFWDILTDQMTWSANAASLFGVSDDALLSSRTFSKHLDADNLVNRYDTVMGSNQIDYGHGVPYQIEFSIHGDDGQKKWLEDTGRWYAGPNGRPSRCHGLVRVITERHMNEQRLAYLSRYDPLTGLANKMRVEDVLADVLNSCRRYKTSGSFLLCAIDRLADLNTTFGYDVADQVLVELSKRLRKEVRAGDCIGRLSGNKFAVVLSNCGHDQMEIAARRFRQAANDAVVVTAAGPVSITLSVGGAVFPKASETAQSIVMSAHEALNQAREQGANSFVAYHRSSERETMRQANLRTAEQIVQALSNKTLSLALQPIVDAETGDIAFHEALLRLTSPTGSLTTASHLIEPAERFRLTPLVDRHVLELAVKQLAINPMLSVSINVSASTAKDMEWIVAFMDAAKSIPDFANRMIIEITETAVIDDMTATRGFINKIHEVGCKVAIDDFGAGYTSFRNLRALDVDIVKIDGSFMKNISESKDDQVFVKALVGIATALNIKTVAEWVETDADAAFLSSIGIDYIQGFTFGEPVAASDKSMDEAATDEIVTAA